MRLLLATIAAVSVLAGAASAQPATGSGSSNPPVANKPAGSPQTTGTVELGANSFTEAQARSRLEAQDFKNVTELRKDDQGIWRGKAMHAGKSVSVAIDYKGTVQAQ